MIRALAFEACITIRRLASTDLQSVAIYVQGRFWGEADITIVAHGNQSVLIDPSATCRIEVQLYHFKTPDSAVHVFFGHADRLTLPRSIVSPELMMWFVLATKMAVTALFVTAATIIAERLGATVGALVATLPVSAGPVYVFLALDH